MEKYNFPAVILAGGKSSRMGEDKALLPFKTYSTLCQYQYEKLQKIFSTTYISTKTDKFDFITNQNTLIFDNDTNSSPMIALQSILNTIKDQYCFIIPVDMPTLSDNIFFTITNNFLNTPSDVVIAKDILGKTHNLCGIFHKNILPTIKILLNQDIHKIGALLKSVDTTIIQFDTTKEFANLNTPIEYQKLLI